ncbi:hypothetical protein [Gaetbulibacter aestuarii]|uniref:Phage holin family protein n=1 Tax=Gaetbulibacter aestuarii TaxID=1502358 RepID=A0ABW7MX71_9FLAO
MEFFENLNEASDKLGDAGKTYVEKSQEYYKLKVFQQVSDSISMITKIVIIGGLLFTALIFLAFALAIYLGDLLGSQSLGYVITAGLIIVIAIIFYISRRKIDNIVIRRMSTNFFDV